jgi:peptidoglycan-associated lipoprotein
MRPALHFSLIFIAATSLVVGCKKKPAVTAPKPSVTANTDRARLDSIERAESARRVAAEQARLEAEKRAAREAVVQALTAPVYFALDQADLTDDGRQALDEKREAMHNNPAIRIRIEGHADDTGSDEYNMALGERRAAMARRHLVQGGIAEGRIQIVSRGEERPACPTRDESCRSRNRRDEFVVLSGI